METCLGYSRRRRMGGLETFLVEWKLLVGGTAPLPDDFP